ncbi:hypothetical protein RNZ50_16560 [Paracoccaceae bacterium Fryx2]|nr:hypothetical protein [Paracoccaceae bacterium Fryx2]
MAGLGLMLAACLPAGPVATPSRGVLQTAMPFSQIRVGSIWTTEPLALIGIQRGLPGQTEQIVGLANDTTLRGDNFLLMLARVTDGQDVPAFRLEEFVKRAGGSPSPFGTVSDSNLQSGSDSLGPYVWLEYRSGAQTNCVLALRRLGVGSRMLPARANVMDVMLRNCVLGSIEEALAPMLEARMGGGVGAGARSTVMLSPLAGPTP